MGYFKNLVMHEWVVHKGPGGHFQWRVNGTSPTAPGPQGGRQNIMMLTSDVSLTKDPSYRAIVEDWATIDGVARFDHAWKHAWYKLTTRDMGPVTRCLGPDTPPAQPFQFPLPAARPPESRARIEHVRAALHKLGGGHSFAALAWQCASTFRITDYQGGCNGARIRFAPQLTWPANRGLDTALGRLQPIKDQFGAALSWADLIVLAGSQSIHHSIPFCDGRTDAAEGSGWADLMRSSTMLSSDSSSSVRLNEFVMVLGLTAREFVALNGGAYSLTSADFETSGLTNVFFTDLLTRKWTLDGDEGEPCLSGVFGHRAIDHATGALRKCHRYKSTVDEGAAQYMFKSDLLLKFDGPMRAIVDEFAADASLFKLEFVAAWTKVMNADRFDGPVGNLCSGDADESPARDP